MTYFLKSNKRNNKTILFGVILTIFLITLNVFFQKNISGFLHFFGGQLWSFDTKIEKNQTSETLFSFKKNLIQENEKLKNELLKARVKILKKEIIEAENKDLKKICNREIEDKESVLAQVIKRPGTSADYDFFIIDIGKNKNIKKGDLATVKNEFVIGLIENVFAETAEVKLFSSPENFMNVVLIPSNIEIEIEGRGGGNFSAEIPKGNNVNKGDAITYPLLSDNPIAIIEEIIEKPANPFKTLFLKIPTNIYKTSWIKIIKK